MANPNHPGTGVPMTDEEFLISWGGMVFSILMLIKERHQDISPDDLETVLEDVMEKAPSTVRLTGSLHLLNALYEFEQTKDN